MYLTTIFLFWEGHGGDIIGNSQFGGSLMAHISLAYSLTMTFQHYAHTLVLLCSVDFAQRQRPIMLFHVLYIHVFILGRSRREHLKLTIWRLSNRTYFISIQPNNDVSTLCAYTCSFVFCRFRTATTTDYVISCTLHSCFHLGKVTKGTFETNNLVTH